MEQIVEEAKKLRMARLAWHKPYLSGIVMMMGVARLRLLTQHYAVAFFAVAALPFCRQKKSTNGKTGLPSVALAKDGGRSRTRIYDLHDVNVTL